MIDVYLSHNNIISSLGFDSKSVVKKIGNEISGIDLIDDNSKFSSPFYSSLISPTELERAFEELKSDGKYTRLEKMLLISLKAVIDNSDIELDDKVGLIISTTKGNIDVLEEGSSFPKERAYLSNLGKLVKDFFGFKNEAIVISNACVSGLLSIAASKKYINQGKFKHVFVVSGDIVTEFILSGFNSFQALSDLPCQPYSKNRSGINIGEVAASVLVTSDKDKLVDEAVMIVGEASCNDANHISGPSRTGEGLVRAVKSAITEAGIEENEIDYISAHGTATDFNDEMEAIAFNRLDLNEVPLNSLKGYFGHTLGASGLLETIIGMHSLNENMLYASHGFEELGVSKTLNVIAKTRPEELRMFLKTASGFGGTNTAVILKKVS
jgi:3-oxoacyl-[acyl-carrier-protein] synthase-1